MSVVVYAFSFSLERQKKVELCECEASLVYQIPGHPMLHSETLSQTLSHLIFPIHDLFSHWKFLSVCFVYINM